MATTASDIEVGAGRAISAFGRACVHAFTAVDETEAGIEIVHAVVAAFNDYDPEPVGPGSACVYVAADIVGAVMEAHPEFDRDAVVGHVAGLLDFITR